MDELIFGKLGDKIYSRRKCRTGVKSVCYDYFIPANPRTAKQQSWRLTFSTGLREWNDLDEATKQKYEEITKGLSLWPKNLFLKFYLKNRSENKDMFARADWHQLIMAMAINWAIAQRKELEPAHTTSKISI